MGSRHGTLRNRRIRCLGHRLAAHPARLEHDVVMWALEPEVAREITTRHANSIYLSGITLPESIRGIERHGRGGARRRGGRAGAAVEPLCAPCRRRRRRRCVATPSWWSRRKGSRRRSLSLMSEVLARDDAVARCRAPGVPLRPDLRARGGAAGCPPTWWWPRTGMAAARKVQELLHSLTLRVYTSADPIGVQIGGAHQERPRRRDRRLRRARASAPTRAPRSSRAASPRSRASASRSAPTR